MIVEKQRLLPFGLALIEYKPFYASKILLLSNAIAISQVFLKITITLAAFIVGGL